MLTDILTVLADVKKGGGFIRVVFFKSSFYAFSDAGEDGERSGDASSDSAGRHHRPRRRHRRIRRQGQAPGIT